MTIKTLWDPTFGEFKANLAFTNNFTATTDPTVSNDGTQGYSPGSTWVNTTAGRIWTMTSSATGAAVWALDGQSGSAGYLTQGAPAVRSTTTTLTGADVLGGLISTVPAGAINLTLPLATDLDTAVGASAPNNTSFDFSIINTSGGANTATVLTNTGWTLLGSMAVAQNVSGRFRARKTGAGAWTLYRLA
jgi:hypothetical protein